MKYIKTYEKLKLSNKYWKIQIRKNKKQILPYLEVALEKLDMNEEEIKFWKFIFMRIEESVIYLFLDNNKEWKFSRYEQKLIDEGYLFAGELVINKEDRDFYKFKQKVKKYNL